MQTLTKEQVREYCKEFYELTDEDILYPNNSSERMSKLKIKTPEEHRRIVALAQEILLFRDISLFGGGFVWLRRWDVGVSELVRPGWRILEDIRRAHGDLRSLEIAPAQLFRHDEFVELHVFLVQIMAYGWDAYFIPGGEYFFTFRSSGKVYGEAKSTQTLDDLSLALATWEPSRESGGWASL
jgi:hypothetical protein